MATEKNEARDNALQAPLPHDDKCANCGACKHCGNGGVKFVPMPYPFYPYPYAQPYRSPYQWPNTQPYLGGLSPNISGTSLQAQGTNPHYSAGQASAGAATQTWNSGAGNYNA